MTCPKCGHEFSIGDWPFCDGSGHNRANVHVIDDSIDGGPRRFETMGDDAPYIDSKSAWKREVKARNIENVDRHDAHYHETWRKQAEEKRRDTARA